MDKRFLEGTKDGEKQIKMEWEFSRIRQGVRFWSGVTVLNERVSVRCGRLFF